ncbi:LexA/Signal peptidase [Laetiporus sulphureus 93-53]|uniref:Mitochondrial inner membrane protease subunit 2 n=1 Tax=Laetiporus sulphureus 93-53 TaxID=1314785 RepID=A0A165IAL8_9APHY|nr:LexA/Signal peptidase [Laetiporus sulphureus 93-53]KZT12811.1 LexA/Signal peptidase [Laetiporus sulphureus 93-53]
MRSVWKTGLRQSWRKFAAEHRNVRRTLSALIWLPSAIIFTQYFYTVKSVRGRSMQPTLNPDWSQWRDIVVFDRFAIRIKHQFDRGDVVALLSPSDSKLIVKRIVALEGDTIKTLPPYPDAEVRVPKGHVWVEGDEPFHSEDSNTFGPVPLALIDSKLSFVVWPLDRYGPLRKPSAPDPKAPRTPAWRLEKSASDHEQWRCSRVTIHRTEDRRSQPPQHARPPSKVSNESD